MLRMLHNMDHTFKIFIIILISSASFGKERNQTEDISSKTNGTETEVTVERDIYGNIINKTQFCNGKICIRKCCGSGHIYHMSSEGANCIADNRYSDIMDLKIYDENLKRSNRKSKDLFTLIDGKAIVPHAFYMSEYMNLYLLERGILKLESPNVYYDHWIELDNDKFCMDYVLPLDSKHVILDGLVVLSSDGDGDEDQDSIITITGTYISCIFLGATLAVYSFLPQLRNLHGKVLMAYVSSMLVGFFTTGTIVLTGQLQINVTEVCHVLSMICYFSLLATFFWMNVMSFDIFWTFRGMFKERRINRRGEIHKFRMYCLYGYGVPLGLTIVFMFLNYLPMRKINPSVITPGITDKGCFISKMERMLYLYTPMLAVILANTALFVATTWNLYQFRRDTRALRAVDSAVQKSTQNRFLLYVKVFFLMGLSWVLEVASSFAPKWVIWKYTDSFNLLIGVSIFVIFVCKKKTFKLIRKRYEHFRSTAPSEAQGRYSSRSESSASTSTIVCHEPYQPEIVNLNPTADKTLPSIN